MPRHDELLFLLEAADLLRTADNALPAIRFQPRVDMYETDAALVIKMELAGVRPERIEVTLAADDSLLTIRGDRTEELYRHPERLKCYQLEIYYGDFERAIPLPTHLSLERDSISANYKDGFLVISLPKKRSKPAKTRSIVIVAE
jgi:HSP20 family protein